MTANWLSRMLRRKEWKLELKQLSRQLHHPTWFRYRLQLLPKLVCQVFPNCRLCIQFWLCTLCRILSRDSYSELIFVSWLCKSEKTTGLLRPMSWHSFRQLLLSFFPIDCLFTLQHPKMSYYTNSLAHPLLNIRNQLLCLKMCWFQYCHPNFQPDCR